MIFVLIFLLLLHHCLLIKYRMEIKLFDCFKDLEDPRRLTHILHPARNIIYIAFAAILCGMRTWEDIEDFGNERIEFFEKRLDLSHGIPSHDTFDRFFQIIDSKASRSSNKKHLFKIIHQIHNAQIYRSRKL